MERFIQILNAGRILKVFPKNLNEAILLLKFSEYLNKNFFLKNLGKDDF